MRCVAVVAASAACLAVLAAAPVFAQEDSSPLRFLRPWLERQIQGGGAAPEPSDPPAAEAAPPSRDEPPESDAATATAPEPPDPSAAVPPPAAAEAAAVTASEPAAVPPPAVPPPVGSTTVPPPAESPAVPPPAEAAAVPAEPAATAAVPPAPALPVAPPLRIAVLAGRSVAETMTAVGPIADDLRSLLDRPVEVLPMTSYAAMIDAQTERRIDGGFYSASAFVAAEARCECLEPLVAPKASDGANAFHALIVARAGSGIASLADLEGKTVAIGAADSIAGRRMQLAGLVAEKIDPEAAFGAVLQLESGDAALRAMMRGKADAAFVWSSMSGDQATGYSRGTLTNLFASGEISMADIAIVWRSPPLVHGPFAASRTLPEDEKEAIASFLLRLEARRPAAYDMLNPFYGGGYAAVDPQDYAGLATLAAVDVDSIRLPGPPAASAAPAP